jgi:hypothetical protein
LVSFAPSFSMRTGTVPPAVVTGIAKLDHLD